MEKQWESGICENRGFWQEKWNGYVSTQVSGIYLMGKWITTSILHSSYCLVIISY